MTETDTIKLEYHSANLGEEAEFTLAEETLEDVDKGHTPGGLLDLESNSNDFAPRKKVNCDSWSLYILQIDFNEVLC